MGQAPTRKRRRIYAAVAAFVLGAILAAPALAGRGADARGIVQIARQVMRERGLEAVIVRVDRGRRTIVRAALGQSIPGVPATAGMHFRLGSMSIPFLTTVLLQLEEEGRLSLDDPLANWKRRVTEMMTRLAKRRAGGDVFSTTAKAATSVHARSC